MSRPVRQKRPSRDETRSRLLDAAIVVIERRGIASASVEEITEEAGFSRGAFYSNFEDKDALVLALLERGTDEAAAAIDELRDRYPDPDEYVRAIQQHLASTRRWNGRHEPSIAADLMLFALRSPTARPLLRARLQRARAASLSAVEYIAEARGLAPADNRATIADMIGAIELGFDIFALIDPDFDANASFAIALDFLAEAGAAIAVAERANTKRKPTRPI